MSIDNVFAVVDIARDNTELPIFGLALAIAFMAFFACADVFQLSVAGISAKNLARGHAIWPSDNKYFWK
mgnify:CR=1 FL=1